MLESSAIGKLKKVRERVVEERRRAANWGLETQHPESSGATIKQLQEAIEAIDRAIADEEKLAGS